MHTVIDGLEKAELGAERIGTTNRGISSSHVTKAGRSRTRLADVLNSVLFKYACELRRLTDGPRKRSGDVFDYDVEEEVDWFNELLALSPTSLCVLDLLTMTKIGVAYKAGGEVLNSHPADLDILIHTVVFHKIPR
ncbi:hypothetical protein BJ166DRAFT_616088 [Pestalotiopsis sp. NC0098]|nr:hypothetical protein BJ166DRAFT_616088 [Pestalotiopsis sp. NC0098]